jgi:hypothetical protein
MSYPEEFPPSPNETGGILDCERMQTILHEIYPYVVLIMPSLLDGKVQAVLDEAGFVSDDMLHSDGSVEQIIYNVRQTPTSQELGEMWLREQAGELPEGSYDQALQEIMDGPYM